MNSCKFRIVGLFIATLFISSVIANPTEISFKNELDVIKSKNVDDVIKLKNVDDVIKPNSEKVVFGIYDRAEDVIHLEGRPDCPDGTIADCSGDGDCCPDSWIGDGFPDCEDQQYGCDLTCYDNDGGDCDGGGTTTTTTGAACDEVLWTTDMTFDWYCTGSPGSGPINFCANGTADLAGYTGTWMAGTGALPMGDGLCPGDAEFSSDLYFMFDNYATIYHWDTEGDDMFTPGVGYHDDMGYNGENNADGLTCINGGDCTNGTGTTTGGTTTGGDCPAGTIEDCSGDGDCCPESWIGDGFPDCEDQQYGCDLTCYDNDGGDCGDTTGGTTGGTTTGGDCPAGTIEDCSGDGDCCPESWIADGFPDCEDQQYGCDLTCYDNDGGDCDGTTGGTTTTTTGGGDAYASFTITFDWYCTGSPGSSTIDLYEDGTALLAGAYSGTWMADGGEYPLGDGLCPGDGSFNNDLSFMFDNYATVYMWEMSDGICSNGIGYHDDMGYNGEGNVDGASTLTYLGGNCEETDPCDGQANGDANADGSVDVLDVVVIVNHILAGGNGLDDCGTIVSDYNGDGSVDVLDVVVIVNLILSGGGRVSDASNATIIQDSFGASIIADGYIGGIQMDISHGIDFTLELTSEAFVAESRTDGNTTKLIVINPENENIFKSSGDYTIDNILVTNSKEFINVTKELPMSFTLSNAYPNPFNPTTSLTLDIAAQSYASVKVYNIRGEVVSTLLNDMVEPGKYEMTWDASNLSSGVYMVKAEANGQIASQKVMLVK